MLSVSLSRSFFTALSLSPSLSFSLSISLSLSLSPCILVAEVDLPLAEGEERPVRVERRVHRDLRDVISRRDLGRDLRCDLRHDC